MINWNYDSEVNKAKITTDNGMDLVFWFEKDGNVLCVSNDDQDFYSSTETSKKMFVLINGEFETIYNLIIKAENMVRESDEEEASEAQYRADTSSLEFTGRV